MPAVSATQARTGSPPQAGPARLTVGSGLRDTRRRPALPRRTRAAGEGRDLRPAPLDSGSLAPRGPRAPPAGARGGGGGRDLRPSPLASGSLAAREPRALLAGGCWR